MRSLPPALLVLASVALAASDTRATHVPSAAAVQVSRTGVADVLALERAAEQEILFSLTPAIGDAVAVRLSVLAPERLDTRISRSAGAPSTQIVVADVELSGFAWRLTGR